MTTSSRIGLLLASILAAAACSSGGGGGSKGTLTSGIYLVPPASVHAGADSCGIYGNYVATLGSSQHTVITAGASFSIDSINGSITGSGFDAATSQQIDFSTDPFMAGALDCIVKESRDFSGRPFSNDHAHLKLTADLSVVSGAQCTQAFAQIANSVGVPPTGAFPCSFSATADLEKIAPLSPPFAGTVDVSGAGAVLTYATNAAGTLGSGTLTGTISGSPVNITSGQTACAGPDPVVLINAYAVAYSDGTYDFQLNIDQANWAVGTLPINGTTVSGFAEKISDGNFLTLTAGSITLNTAPTLINDPGSICDFAATGLTF